MPPHWKVVSDECLHGNMHGELKGAERKGINITIMLIIDLTQFYLCIGGFSMVEEVLYRNGGRRIPNDAHIKLYSSLITMTLLFFGPCNTYLLYLSS